MRKTLAVTGATLAASAAIALSACTSSGSSRTSAMPNGHSMSGKSMSSMPSGSNAAQAPAAGAHNAADIAFSTDMIPHHAQALTMAKMALTKSTDPKVKQLAQRIENEQSPEITTMSGWLKGWGEPVPDTSMDGMHMGGTHMPGMMSAADMAKLDATTGAAFDKLFLTQMIAHHTGAITMATAELRSGRNDQVRTLAKSIIAGQSTEITEMKALLPTIS